MEAVSLLCSHSSPCPVFSPFYIYLLHSIQETDTPRIAACFISFLTIPNVHQSTTDSKLNVYIRQVSINLNNNGGVEGGRTHEQIQRIGEEATQLLEKEIKLYKASGVL